MREFVKSMLAGLAISLGCIVYLSVGGGALGAFLFSIGLLLVIVFKFNLFTGKVCYISPHPADMTNIIKILIGNLLMASVVGTLVRFMKPDLAVIALEISENKMAEGLWLIPLAMLCNFMIYFAVEAVRRSGTPQAYLIVILSVMVFILCGFEHSIANTCYFAIGGTLCTPNGILYLTMNVVGNAIGGLLIHRMVAYTPLQKGW